MWPIRNINRILPISQWEYSIDQPVPGLFVVATPRTALGTRLRFGALLLLAFDGFGLVRLQASQAHLVFGRARIGRVQKMTVLSSPPPLPSFFFSRKQENRKPAFSA